MQAPLRRGARVDSLTCPSPTCCKAPSQPARPRDANMGTENETIPQLNQARELALGQPSVYPQVVPGVLPVIGPSQHLALRRWGADFLAETFASAVIEAEEKQRLSLLVLDTLKSYLSRKEEVGEEEDPSVVKASVQCAASVYPLVFRHTVNAGQGGADVWSKMAGIKSSILRRMDTAAAGVRICCIKFVARVVQVQTSGVITDPRRQDANEISLALVPRDHPVMPPSNLEAEASGLLDRLLGVLQDNISDALIVTATLNALSALVQRRASISTKILGTVLSFDPLRLAKGRMSGKDKVAVRSMTRTTISFLMNVLKRNSSHPLAGRMQQQIDRLRYTLNEAFEQPIKRPAEDEPTDGLDQNKRQKVENSVDQGTTPLQQPNSAWPPPLPPGPVTTAQLFTLNQDPRVAGFDVNAIPAPLVAQLVPALLSAVDQNRVTDVINIVRSRYLEFQKRPPYVPGAEEEDDYDPISGFGDAEQTINQLDQMSPDGLVALPDMAIGPFHLPPPPPLSDQEKAEYAETARERLFSSLAQLDEQARQVKIKKLEEKSGFSRIAAAGHDRDGWITLLTRLITRPSFNLDDDKPSRIKQENDERAVAKKGQDSSLPNKLREALHKYIMDDWRRRIDVAIAWLSEEWYADKLRAKVRSSTRDTSDAAGPSNYAAHALRLLDTLVPFIDIKDGRYLIRFLSELPQLKPQMLERIATVALDPERVNLAVQCLIYLCSFRPPAREAVLDVAEEMWRGNKDARGMVGDKVLKRWRAGVLEAEGGGADGEPVKAEA